MLIKKNYKLLGLTTLAGFYGIYKYIYTNPINNKEGNFIIASYSNDRNDNSTDTYSEYNYSDTEDIERLKDNILSDYHYET